jgi:hypothetical protein
LSFAGYTDGVLDVQEAHHEVLKYLLVVQGELFEYSAATVSNTRGRAQKEDVLRLLALDQVPLEGNLYEPRTHKLRALQEVWPHYVLLAHAVKSRLSS